MEKLLPVRMPAFDQLMKCLQLLLIKAEGVPGLSSPKRICQRDLPDFNDVVRQRVTEFSVLRRIGIDRPHHKLMLRHRLYILMHPGGNAPCHIGVTSLQNHANSHSVYSCRTSFVRLRSSVDSDSQLRRDRPDQIKAVGRL